MNGKVTIGNLQALKPRGEKIVGVVAWDYQIARIVDRAGVDLVSVGDTVGVNLWGHSHPLEVTLDEMVLVASAVRRGVKRALVSCDFPFGSLQRGTQSAIEAAIRLVKEAGVDLVKLDGASDFVESVSAITAAGIPVIAQFGLTPQTALKYGIAYSSTPSEGSRIPFEMLDQLVAEALELEAAGACMLNLTNSGPIVGAAVVAAVRIPVVGGFGGGPWLDGRIRMVNSAIGYAAENVENDPGDAYANVARTTYNAISQYTSDVRAGRQIRGGIPAEEWK
jgi:3-methyl-2-oxobutanoate hydroxymethyltransferase